LKRKNAWNLMTSFFLVLDQHLTGLVPVRKALQEKNRRGCKSPMRRTKLWADAWVYSGNSVSEHLVQFVFHGEPAK